MNQLSSSSSSSQAITDVQPNQSSPFSRFLCGLNTTSASNRPQNVVPSVPPDSDFFGDSLIKLKHGVTAFRIIEPRPSIRQRENKPVIVCLHGMYSSSFMWADIGDLLSDFEQGPNARVLVFDFYGHGRSSWDGTKLTLDVLVTQTKELMDCLQLSDNTMPAALVGYDLGAAVAAGFSAKYPAFCASLSLLSPIGFKYKSLPREKLLLKSYIGEYLMSQLKTSLPQVQKDEFFNQSPNTSHKVLIDKYQAMVSWQTINTPGYLGAILSIYRNFPLRDMEELYAALGRHPRRVLVIVGNKDTVCPYKKCIKMIEESFPEGVVVDIADCGHNVPGEKFEETAKELLQFNKEVFEKKIVIDL